MSFWRTFGFQTVSAVETILETESFTLEELLNEEEILQEVKSQNKKLIDFLVQPATLEKLFEYLTVESPDEDQQRQFKYPYLACEILFAEIWNITEAIYENEDLLRKLYWFLEAENPSQLLTTYTTRVAGNLLLRKVAETVAFLKSIDNVMDKFIANFHNSSVMELLMKLVAAEEAPEGSGILEWLNSCELVPKLVEKFNPELGDDSHENASQALVDIVAISNNITNTPGAKSPLVEELESKPVIERLLHFVLTSSDKPNIMLSGFSIIIELLKRNASGVYNTQPLEDVSPLLQVVLEKLGNISNILVNDQGRKLSMTFGQLTPAFGFHRLKILEFFVALVGTNYLCVDNAITELGILSNCLDLFFTYEWNNFVHSLVEQLVSSVLERDSFELKKSLFTNSKLAGRIVEAYNTLSSTDGDPKGPELLADRILEGPGCKNGVRRGYMGFLNNITASAVEAAEVDTALSELLEGIEGWTEAIQGPYTEIRTIETIQLGGHKPSGLVNSSDEEDEFDEKGANSELVNVFTQYLVQQGYTNDFPDDFNDAEEDYDDDGEIIFDADAQFDDVFHTDDKKFAIEFDDDDSSDELDSDDDFDDSEEEEEEDEEEEEVLEERIKEIEIVEESGIVNDVVIVTEEEEEEDCDPIDLLDEDSPSESEPTATTTTTEGEAEAQEQVEEQQTDSSDTAANEDSKEVGEEA